MNEIYVVLITLFGSFFGIVFSVFLIYTVIYEYRLMKNGELPKMKR